MVNCSAGQSALNMLRRMIIVLPLCGLLAICSCTVVHRDVYTVASVSSNCGADGNSTACATETGKIVTGSGRNMLRVSRNLQDPGSDDNEVEEESGRKKKGRGYWKLLLYFLGAGKVTMLYVVLNAVAAIAAKALVVAKVALAIATAIALKKSSEHKEKVSYEIIKHPYHSYEQTHSSSIDFDNHGYGEGDFGYRKRRKVLQ
ncbi:uncharacterized protein LOC117229251 [Megalopta genalis]|uniref:uncharacterized protein LOC117229251 n=1 Tax=Megalopta genalis TaxID=115081 RepID=UPI003FD19788